MIRGKRWERVVRAALAGSAASSDAHMGRGISREMAVEHLVRNAFLVGDAFEKLLAERELQPVGPPPSVPKLPADPGRMPTPRVLCVSMSGHGGAVRKSLEDVGLRVRSPFLNRGPQDVQLSVDDDPGAMIVEAITLSGLLWVDDLTAVGARPHPVIGDRVYLPRHTPEAAAQRIAAAGLPPGSVEIEDVNGDATLTARSPEGVRWVRLCRHLGARMLEPWEGMPEAAEDPGPKAFDEGSGA